MLKMTTKLNNNESFNLNKFTIKTKQSRTNTINTIGSSPLGLYNGGMNYDNADSTESMSNRPTQTTTTPSMWKNDDISSKPHKNRKKPSSNQANKANNQINSTNKLQTTSLINNANTATTTTIYMESLIKFKVKSFNDIAGLEKEYWSYKHTYSNKFPINNHKGVYNQVFLNIILYVIFYIFKI